MNKIETNYSSFPFCSCVDDKQIINSRHTFRVILHLPRSTCDERKKTDCRESKWEKEKSSKQQRQQTYSSIDFLENHRKQNEKKPHHQCITHTHTHTSTYIHRKRGKNGISPSYTETFTQQIVRFI